MITKGETYIIGEIGQNHNGSVDIAKLIVELIARPVHEDVFSLIQANECSQNDSARLERGAYYNTDESSLCK